MTPRRWVSREAAVLCVVTGEREPVAAITKLATDLLDLVGFEQPPFSPEVLASFRDVREIRRVSMTGAGRLLPEAGALVIEVNRDHSLGKQNFSADHEVVHTLLPTYCGQRVEDTETGTFTSSKEEEALCDIGASTLLLDPRRLRSFAEDIGASIRTLIDLATLFEASLEATARHLAQLDLWPCAFVFWEEGHRKAERIPDGQPLLPGLANHGGPQLKLRVKSPYVAPSFGYFVPDNKSVDESSLVAMCCEDEPLTHGVEEFDLGGRQPVRLYCESYFAPYRRHEVIRHRVISLLLRSPFQGRVSAPQVYQMETL